ncbi:MAG: hypothetical protein SFU85_06550 [Candidatus Methylacidiphilales bacterium]|nr:hypothetical protein [Candidatus Methylacidiphilales bacterium]
MKTVLPILCFLAMSHAMLSARERINLAEDDAAHSAYNGGWNNGGNAANSGFGGWQLVTSGADKSDRHAGFIIARREAGNELDHADIDRKAFGLYANGSGFETAVAFRNLDNPLGVGESFSLLMEAGDFAPKTGSDDPKPGWVGFALRTGTASASTEDIERAARFVFGVRQGESRYFVRDGGKDTDTGVEANGSGVAVTVTLVSADAYDLEITALDTKVTKRFAGRRLAGPPGGPIESFALCNQDGEKGDAYFNGFQVTRLVESLPR